MAVEGSQIQLVLGSGDLLMPFHVGNQYAAATLNSASGTGATTLITGAPGYIITELGFQVDPISTASGGATINVRFVDSSFGLFANFLVYVPATVTLPVVSTTIRQVNQGPFVWNNKVANSTCAVNLSTAVTAGSVRCFVRYALTNFLG